MRKGAVFGANAALTPTPALVVEDGTPDGAAPPPAHKTNLHKLRPLTFARFLTHHPNAQFVTTLIRQLTEGFDIGYQGPHRDLRSPNLPSAFKHPEVIDHYIAHECAQGRMAGPFVDPPFQPFHCSGLGTVPKGDGTWRVITHLSAPDGLSINDHIDPESVSLSYTTVDEAIAMAQQLGQGTLLAKIDLKSAFRQCPVRPADWHLLGLYWRGRYYYDKCLPFGLRSSPFLFNTVATALEYIFRQQLSNQYIIHYLDDFLIAGPPQSPLCTDTFSGIESLCTQLGIVTKVEKRTPPTTSITFLGVQLDTVARVASLPQDKLHAILHELAVLCGQSRCTKRNLLSLIGKLAFAAKVIPAGRIFTRRLIDASTKAKSLHHHIRLSSAMRADMNWWTTFATGWNGRSFFLDHSWTPSPAFQLFTDASDQGYGAYWRGHWICDRWSRSQVKHHIQWKELFAVLVAATAWGSQWGGKRLLVHCDNHAVVDIWHTGTSKQAALMCLVRSLFFVAAQNNFTLLLQHIQGTNNCVADALSRFQLCRFRSLAPDADLEPTPTPVPEILT